LLVVLKGRRARRGLLAPHDVRAVAEHLEREHGAGGVREQRRVAVERLLQHQPHSDLAAGSHASAGQAGAAGLALSRQAAGRLLPSWWWMTQDASPSRTIRSGSGLS
jgi:hypothetical protein